MWNLTRTTFSVISYKTWWNPDRTLMEILWHLKPPRTTPQPSQNLVDYGGTFLQNLVVFLVERWWNPHPASLVEPQNPGPPWSLSGLRPQSFQLLGKNVIFWGELQGRGPELGRRRRAPGLALGGEEWPCCGGVKAAQRRRGCFRSRVSATRRRGFSLPQYT